MAGKIHPWIDTSIKASIVFFASILFIVFVALFVRSVYLHNPQIPAEQVEQNLQPTGKVYPRQ